MTEMSIDMYRDALHIYLKHAYPNDDEQYYSKWAFLVSPTHYFFAPNSFNDVPFLPREVRFGCYFSGNTKLRAYKTGFMFDTNHCGDQDEIIKQLMELKKEVEDEWRRVGLPVHGDQFDPPNPKAQDITGSEGVEVKVRNDGTVLWVNTIEGGCVLRICRIKEIVVEDERKVKS